MTFWTLVYEWQHEQQEYENSGNHHCADDFQLAREIFEQLKQEKKIPLRTRSVCCVIWISTRFGRNTNKICERHEKNEYYKRNDNIFKNNVREERHALFLGHLIVLKILFLLLFVHGYSSFRLGTADMPRRITR